MSSITTSALEAPARRSVEKTCDDLAFLVLGVVAIVAGLTFRDYGLGWDDYTHAEYADLLLRMYESGFKDTGALSFANLYMYGGGFDMAAALLHKVIPLELFETRRLLGAIVGVIGLAITWRLARRIGGPLAGLAALLLLALCPTFYGHMFMNPKDAPFAVAMMVLIMGLVRLIEEYPAPSPRTILLVGFGAGLSLGCRVLGGLALIYAVIGFIPLWIEEFRKQGAREAIHRFAHVAYVLLPGLAFGYLVMGLIWPWSIMEPGHPLEAVTYFSHFFEKPWKEMFDGALVSVPDMPWSYLPTLFALQLPEVLLALLAAAVIATFMSLSRTDVTAKRKSIMLMLTLAAMLPLVIAMVKRPALYNGIRHFIFVIPPMTVLAGVAFARGMDWLGENRRVWQARGARGVRIRPLAAAQRDDPTASISVYAFQPHRRHGADRRQFLHAGLLGSGAEAGIRRAARAVGGAAGSAAAASQVEGRGVRTTASRASRARPRLHDRLGQQRGRFRDDARRVLLQGPGRARDGRDQARRRRVRPRLRHPRPQHLEPALDSRAVAPEHPPRGCPPTISFRIVGRMPA